ncbi:nucleotidyl transferase AbiEii/AbiGii toxin family protein [Sporichthya sp.]|uniref:nucleotidyl transferase AbiEii/AbiGii toxin family protein n=1 Tax=Sporichthya sp. TaxID=65475 RepID=UPI0017E7C281|nr:nucleotidyl transferase AbiEii/AbiGii toxin family protein [Sporichthya sp.]MBA3742377.1 nucleotidyl transferase AbiEii/AbiGii toxin family protein [Sporichthya sp.]
MNVVEAALTRVTSDLRSVAAEFALVGGFGVSAHTEPRFTRDVDLVVAVSSDDEAESLVHALTGRGYEIVTLIEQYGVGRLGTARLTPPGLSGVVVDLLFAVSGVEPEIVAAARVAQIMPGLTVPVAGVGHLIAMKLLSRASDRPHDDADLDALRAVATESDRDVARAAATQISTRGFNRDRDLVALTDAFLAAP